MEDVSATSNTGAMLGLLISLIPSVGRDSVGPLADRQLVSCKSIATVPETMKHEHPSKHLPPLLHNRSFHEQRETRDNQYNQDIYYCLSSNLKGYFFLFHVGICAM